MLRFEAFTTAARRTFSPLAQDVGREIGRKLSKSLVNFAQSAFRRLANDLFVRMVLKSLWWRGSLSVQSFDGPYSFLTCFPSVICFLSVTCILSVTCFLFVT